MKKNYGTGNQPEFVSEPAVDKFAHTEKFYRAVIQYDGVIVCAVPTMPRLRELLDIESTMPTVSSITVAGAEE